MTAFFFLVGTVLSYLLPIILHIHEIKLCRFFFGSLTMMFLTPTFINVFVIYAIANLHDISWGTRPSQNAGLSKKQQDQKDRFEIFRSKVLILWLLFNAGFGYAIIYLSRRGQNNYILVLAIFVGIVLWLRLLFSLCNLIISCCDSCCLKRHTTNVRKQEPRQISRTPKQMQEWEEEDRRAEEERVLLEEHAQEMPAIVRIL